MVNETIRTPVFIRRATAADQPAIRALVRAARINPSGLRWERFLVADDGAHIVGIGQIKPHRGGVWELASIAVRPERQGEQIASAIVRTLLRGATPPLFLICSGENVGFYLRFGFRVTAPSQAPAGLRLMLLAGNTVAWLLGQRLFVMRWGDQRDEAGSEDSSRRPVREARAKRMK
jgi:N-acetylglutamate synthase-like GNAT family acetyltransferase